MGTPGPSYTQDDRQINLAVNLCSRDGTVTKDGRLTNCYLDVDKNGKKRVRRRPGLAQSVAAIGLGQALSVVGSNALAIAGNLVVAVTTRYTDTGSNVAFPGVGTGFTAALNSRIYAIDNGCDVYVGGVPALSFSKIATGALGGTSKCMITHNGKLWATSSLSFGKYSSDGITWTSPSNAPGAVILQSSGATRLFACAANIVNGATFYYTDDEGATAWSTDTFVTPGAVTFTTPMLGVHRGVYWALAGGVAYSSTDFKTWTQVGTSTSISPAVAGGKIISYNGFMYAINSTTLYSSITGVTWTNTGSITTSDSGNSLASLNSNTLFYSNFSKIGYFKLSTTVITSGTIGSSGFASGEQVDVIGNTGATKVLIKGRNVAYVFNPATGLMTQVTDADYPVLTVRGAIYIDGVFYVMDPSGTIWGSADEDPSSWDPANFLNAETEPDGGVCLTKYLNYAVALGQWSTQFFWDTGTSPGTALAPVQNGIMMIGCAHADSVVQIESTLLWIAQRKGSGSTAQKGRFIAMLQGTSYVEVSTDDVERILDTDDLATVYSCALTLNGKTFYCLSLGTSLVTLVYDMKEKLWYTMTRRTATSPVTITALTQTNGLATATATSHGLNDGDFVTISGATQSGYNLSIPITKVDANTFTYPVASATVSPATGSPVVTGSSESYFDMAASANLNGAEIVLDAGTGTVWTLSQNTFADNSQPIDMRIRTQNVDNGNNEWKFCSSVAAIGDMTSSAKTALLRYSDDDYQTYSTYRRFDMSQVRNNQQRYGKYRRRAWEWRFNDTTVDHRLEALEVDLKQGV